MNKHKARKLILEVQNELKADATGDATVKRQFWMDKVQAYIRTIFGDWNDHIALPMYDTYYNGYRPFDQMDDAKTQDIRTKLEELFNTYLNLINNKVYHKRNILSNDSNGTLVAVLIAVGSLIGSWAFVEGQRSADVKNYEMKDSVRYLKAQLYKFTKHS